jgi:hypothetical protein
MQTRNALAANPDLSSSPRRWTRSAGAWLLLGALALPACSPAFLAGAGVGVLGTGAKYEYDKKREMDRLDRAFERGSIDRDEYLRRKRQIEKGSVVR